MPIPDDERFESYLKQFRPTAAEPLPLERRGIRRGLVFTLAAAAALAILAASVLAIRLHRQPASSVGVKNLANVVQLRNSQPLTLGYANELLTHARSFKAAIDGLPFQSERTQVPEGGQSALAALSKEETKL